MLFPKELWTGLADGSIRVAFRRWRRPTVKAGGTLRTPAGVLAIDALTVVEEERITDADAVLAGYPDRTAVIAALPPDPDRTLYRIAFHHAGPDPRTTLRARSDVTDIEVADLVASLERLDARSDDGAWTRPMLQLIADHPACRAADLAASVGQDTARFKRRVRRLKELGLTESLNPGYRLSPRGTALLERLPAR